jgi:hypothetical protein
MSEVCQPRPTFPLERNCMSRDEGSQDKLGPDEKAELGCYSGPVRNGNELPATLEGIAVEVKITRRECEQLEGDQRLRLMANINQATKASDTTMNVMIAAVLCLRRNCHRRTAITLNVLFPLCWEKVRQHGHIDAICQFVWMLNHW